jgi:hypothetical protein
MTSALRTRLGILAGLALCFGASLAEAAFTSDIVSKKTAEATLNVSGGLTVAIKNVSDNGVATQLGWSGVTAAWKESDQYLEIDYASNEIGWGVQVYTDNHNVAASPAYTGPTATGYEGAGLVGVSDPTQYASIAWTARDSVGARPAITTDVNGALLSNNGWAYFKDKLQSGSFAFVNADDYITVVNASGLAKNDGTGRNSSAATPVVVYLSGNFRGLSNQVYRTNQLTIELYHQ